MSTVTADYVENLPSIYRDVIDGFWMFNPNFRPDWGIAPESLYSILHDRYTLGEVREACEQMAAGGALRKEDDFFFQPTDLGREMIQLRQAKQGRHPLPEFVPPKT